MGKRTENGDVISYEYVKFQPEADDQVIYIWDIDKTYLDTKFDTFRGLIKTAFEKAFQKVNVPGSASLIRSLGTLPIYFISASPPQMEAKIYQKMQIDGLNPFGIYLKTT